MLIFLFLLNGRNFQFRLKYAYKLMRKPGWVFDSRSIVKPEQVIEANLKLWRIGDGSK